MADKTDRRTKRPKVVTSHGTFRFQTGLATANLLQRGLPMDRAMSISKMLRNRISDRAEITSEELVAELSALLGELGISDDEVAAFDVVHRPDPFVIGDLSASPAFARHLLMRDLAAIGLDFDRAAEVGRGVTATAGDGSALTDLDEIDALMTRLLAEEGTAFPRRYQLLRWIRQVQRPVVIFVAGATGTGKSTLAMELAFRLGIRAVVGTDMIRETMRTVLSSQVVPGLHDHSFRGMLEGGQKLSDPQERVLAGFRQQAAQVAVGIRGVIGRALREDSNILIEGTHLVPPFSAYLPPGAEVLHGGLMLAVANADAHRARFPSRARRQRLRDPAAYLDAFQSVRWIHDDLLSAAEDNDVLVLATGNIEPTALSALDLLAEALPTVERPPPAMPQPRPRRKEGPRTLLVILDGASDEPNPALEGLTPLAAATTPTLRTLASAGGQGQIDTTGPDGTAHTDVGLWALLGAAPPDPPIGRGLCEALGLGLALPAGAVVFRGNLATADDQDNLVDRRAGRIKTGVEDLLAGLRTRRLANGIRGSIFPGHEHRVVVMLTGPGLSAAVTDTDPGGSSPIQRILEPRPLDADPEAARTAAALRELLDLARRQLIAHPHNAERTARGLPAANCVITRGAAGVRIPAVESLHADAAMVSGCPTALGVARMLGIQPVRGPRMTGNTDTDLEGKFSVAADLLRHRELVVVHVKGTDILAHERRPLAKRDFISQVDEALGAMLDHNGHFTDNLRVIVTADHGTSSITGNHIDDPVPVLLGTWQGPGDEDPFDEESASHGALGLLEPGELQDVLW